MPRYRARCPMPRHYNRLGFTLEVDPQYRTAEVLKWLRDCERIVTREAAPLLRVTAKDGAPLYLQFHGRVHHSMMTRDYSAWWSYPAGEQARA